MAQIQRNAPLLELENATVRRSGRDILSIEKLTIERGEQVVVLGPNGAGKSTLVKLLTHEIRPLFREKPPVRFCGNPRPVTANIRRLVGVVSMTAQSQITVHLPVIEIVLGGLFGSLGIPARCAPTEGQCAKARECLCELGIEQLEQRDILTLSTGQGRRVLIARALVGDPSIMVLDEPSSGLDPEGAWHVRQSLAAMARAGRSIMLVTHLVEDIQPEMNRVLLVKDGRLVGDGAKVDMITQESLQTLFDVPLQVLRTEDGIYHAW